MWRSFTASGSAILMALLALAPRQAAAGPPQFDPFDSAEAPSLVLGVSPGQVRRLDLEFDDDLRALDAFGGKRRIDGFSRPLERRGAWTLYGRLGVFNFQNKLDPQEGGSSLRLTLHRTGPRLTGRIYVGIHRQF